MYQKRFKKERKARVRMQKQLDSEIKRRNHIEDALKASGAPAEALRLLSGKILNLIYKLIIIFSSWKQNKNYSYHCADDLN